MIQLLWSESPCCSLQSITGIDLPSQVAGDQGQRPRNLNGSQLSELGRNLFRLVWAAPPRNSENWLRKRLLVLPELAPRTPSRLRKQALRTPNRLWEVALRTPSRLYKKWLHELWVDPENHLRGLWVDPGNYLWGLWADPKNCLWGLWVEPENCLWGL